MGIEDTWIKLNRKILNWGWYKDTNTKVLFIHLLLISNIKDNEFLGYMIKRGQRATSLASLSNETGLSIRNVRTSLNHLKVTGEVTVSRTPKFSIITVLQYEKYQQVTSLPTIDRQATDKQATSDRQQYKNVKNDKNVKKEKEKKKPDFLDEIEDDIKKKIAERRF